MRRTGFLALALLVLVLAVPGDVDAACQCGGTRYRVAMLGDSQTQGIASSVAPAVTLRAGLGYPHIVFGYGVSSDTACSALVNRWPAIRDDSNHFNVLVQQLGGNDVLTGATAEATYACVEDIWDDALAAGWRVVAFTIAPFKGYFLSDATKEARRNTLNGLIRTGAALRGLELVDADTLLKDEADADVCQDSPDYCAVDNLHWTTAAWAVLAADAATQILNP